MNFFEQFLQNENSLLKQYSFLLAVSGGIDSVVLCDLFSKASADFFIAHCNFQLRGPESERDEDFVRKLAANYHKNIQVKKFDTVAYADEQQLSIQVAARQLRYSWFKELAANQHVHTELSNSLSIHQQGEKNISFFSRPILIVTAHHADDNIETVMMHFFRGTGLKGLTGMQRLNNGVYRPLLAFRKEEIIDYARNHNLSFVEDSSNSSNNYTRNYFRNELLPAISKVYATAGENILKNIHRLQETAMIYDTAIKDYKRKFIEIKGSEEHLPILKFQQFPAFKTLLWEIISSKNFTAAQVDEVVKLMDADNGSYVLSPTHRIIKNRRWLIITGRENSHLEKLIIIEKDNRLITFDDKQLTLEYIPALHYTITNDNSIAALDASTVQYPLLLRQARQGDYFYPLGMMKKKKLSKFFIDQKLSKTEKENVWVLEMNKKIIWVVGYRIDDRFKIKTSTRDVLKIHFQL